VRFFLHGKIRQRGTVTGDPPIIQGWVIGYTWWQRLLSRLFPNTFPTVGVWMKIDGDPDHNRMAGWTVDELRREQ
jgi:hypothetical protein